MPPQASPADLAHTPAASAPPGYISNLEDPLTKDTTANVALTIVLMVFSTTFLIIRVYTKTLLARTFGLDDVMLILAWCMSMMVQGVILYYMTHDVIGTHIWDVSLEDFQDLAKITAVVSVIYLVVMALCKGSILLFYLKISREKWFTYAIHATMVLVVGYTFSLMCGFIFACTPLKRVWDVTITEGHCINQGQMYMATAGFNAATDIIMLALPMPIIRKLQIPLRQKVGLVAIFGVGSFTMVTSIVRLCLMPPLIHSLDMPWHLTQPSTWINIEGNLVVICGCLPILRLFLKHTCPRLLGESSNDTPRKRANDTIGSAELSTLSKSKRCMRNYLRMDESDLVPTQVGRDDSSETRIMATSAKPGIVVDTVEVDRIERHDSTATPTPYSRANDGFQLERPRTPPKPI